MVKIIKPTIEYKEKYKDMIKEWQEHGEPYVPCIIEFDCGNPVDELDYDALLNVIEEYGRGNQEDKEYFEASDFYFVFDDDSLIGACEIRKNLTELGSGTIGHLACGIRPSERKKGYALLVTEVMLSLMKDAGVEEAIICHYSENKISERLLQKLKFNLVNKLISSVTGKEIKCYTKKI